MEPKFWSLQATTTEPTHHNYWGQVPRACALQQGKHHSEKPGRRNWSKARPSNEDPAHQEEMSKPMSLKQDEAQSNMHKVAEL